MGSDGFISLEEARAQFAGKPPRARLHFWARVGMDHGRIKLKVERPGQKMMTKKEWCEEFQRAVTAYLAAGRKSQNGKHPETPAKAKRRRAKVAKRLDALGVGK